MSENLKYSYVDTFWGTPDKTFLSLSEVIMDIENLPFIKDSNGVIFQNENPVLEYTKRKSFIFWKKTFL